MVRKGVVEPIVTLARAGLDPKSGGDREAERYALLLLANLSVTKENHKAIIDAGLDLLVRVCPRACCHSGRRLRPPRRALRVFPSAFLHSGLCPLPLPTRPHFPRPPLPPAAALAALVLCCTLCNAPLCVRACLPPP
jgi:hypothetical protein